MIRAREITYEMRRPNAIPFVKTDGGRSLSAYGTRFWRKDCAVRATAIACGISYEEAIAVTRFDPKKGVMNFDQIFFDMVINGWSFSWISFPRSLTRLNFHKQFPVGRFIGYERGGLHAVAYIDGVRYDDGIPYQIQKMTGAWKLERDLERMSRGGRGWQPKLREPAGHAINAAEAVPSR
jgi:hypothetical protein